MKGKPVRYFLREGNELLTSVELEKEFNSNKGDPDLPTTFAEFLELCMWYNNGSLREIPSADMRWVHVTEMTTTENGIITEPVYDERIFRVREMVSNPSDISADGTISVTIRDGEVVAQKGRSAFHRPSRWTWKKGEGLRWHRH